jgi:hypothetical protein
MEWLREQGYNVEKVEMPWNPYTKKRKDFAGFADAIAWKKGVILAVQACGAGSLAEHERKIRSAPLFPSWVAAGSSVMLVGWSQRVAYGKDGKKLKVKRWKPKWSYIIP